MAAQDKLIPTAIILSNNLNNTRFSSSANFKLPAKKNSLYDNPFIDCIKFFASLYAKELKIADSNAVWNHELVNGLPQTSPFTPDQNVHHLSLGMVLAISEVEWEEVQTTISRSFNIVNPLKQQYFNSYSQDYINACFKSMGIFAKTSNSVVLQDAAGNLLPGSPYPLVTDEDAVAFANAWNIYKVPADQLLCVETYFIAPIKKQTGENFYFRYTGKRRWMTPFENYKSL